MKLDGFKIKRIVIFTLILFTFAIASGLAYFFSPNDTKDPIKNNESLVSITPTENGWNKLVNSKYHYQITFPNASSIVKNPEYVRLIYDDPQTGRYVASLDMMLIGLLDEPIERTASRIASSEIFKKTTINGYQAIKLEYKQTYSINPPIEYEAYVIRNLQNINLLIRIDASIGSGYKELLEEALKTFQFTFNNDQLRKSDLKLFGTTRVRTGNCMPGSNSSCKRKPISTTIYAYPLTTDHSFVGQNKRSLLVAKTRSNWKGEFSLNLPPGTYSIYLDDRGKEYCNSGDGYGNMCRVTMYESNEEYNPIINHAAD